MKINRIRFAPYGKFEDFSLSFSPNLNVVYGKNEAGKSTLYDGILTLLYGFSPVNKDKHPYTSWQSGGLQLFSEIEANGELFSVERSLKSTPRFNFVNHQSNTSLSGRNESIFTTYNISRDLYKSVFHLTSEDLNALEKLSWSQIQDKLLFSEGNDYLKPTNEVLEQIESDIRSIWRDDKKGSPKISGLNTSLAALGEQMGVALKRFERELEIVERQIQLEKELESARSTRHRSEIVLKKERPIRELQNRLEEVGRTYTNKSVFLSLPLDLLERREMLLRKIDELTEKMNQRNAYKEQLLSERMRLTVTEEECLPFLTHYEVLKMTLNQLEVVEREEHALFDESLAIKDKIDAWIRLLFDRALTDAEVESLHHMQVIELMPLVSKVIEYKQSNEKILSRQMKQVKSKRIHASVLVLIGFLLFGGGFYMAFLSWIGVFCIGYGVAELIRIKQYREEDLIDTRDLENRIQGLVGNLKMPEHIFEIENPRFFSKLEQLVSLYFDEQKNHIALMRCVDEKEKLHGSIEPLFKQYSLDSSRGIKLTLQFLLTKLELLKEKLENQERITVKVEEMHELMEMEQNELASLEQQKNACEFDLLALGEGDLEMGIDRFKANRLLAQKQSVYEDELQKAVLDAPEVRLDTPTTVESLEEAIEQLYAIERQLSLEQQRLLSELKQLREEVDITSLQSQKMVLEGEKMKLIEQRDLLLILRTIIDLASERYRQIHQPALINRVSELLSRMTGGKYSKVLLGMNEDKMNLQLVVDQAVIPASAAFSKGTLQQLFLAFRLAVIEVLDPNGHLPLVIDEGLVNWDDERRSATAALLSDLSQQRQIIVLTCHEAFATSFEKNHQAHRITLNF